MPPCFLGSAVFPVPVFSAVVRRHETYSSSAFAGTVPRFLADTEIPYERCEGVGYRCLMRCCRHRLPVYFRFRWTLGPHDVRNARSGPIPGKDSGAFAGSQRIRKKRCKSLSDPVFRFFPILRFFAVRPVFPKVRLSEAAMRFAARSAPFGIPEFVLICILSRKRTLLFHYLCVFRTAERRSRTGRRNEKNRMR